MNAAAASPPGWHGKLPSLGDFASRRLDADFVEPWDAWLSAGLAALREQRPDGWLEDYLGSPSWRFLLMPGVMPGAAGAGGWAGVLMPSVDRVGRYFPLTLVQPLGGHAPCSTQQMAALWHWLGRLDELARDALYDDWTADRLEQELARMAPVDLATAQGQHAAPAAMHDGDVAEAEPQAADAALLIGVEAQHLWAQGARGRAFWQARPDEGTPRLLLSRGLPAAAAMARFFGPAATMATP